jgi:hypothetical protein
MKASLSHVFSFYADNSSEAVSRGVQLFDVVRRFALKEAGPLL